MKFVLVLFALVAGIWAATLPESEKTLIHQVHESCQANPSTHADHSLLKKLSEHKDNPAVMAHMLCMARGMGMTKPSGTLDKTVIKTKISLMTDDHNIVDSLVTKCAIQHENPAKTAMDMWLCLHENNIDYMPVL